MISGVHFSCGLEDNFFLPQVPEGYITNNSITGARVRIPQLINSGNSHYASRYNIFYRIYISDFNATSINVDERRSISQTLANDFNTLYRHTDPTANTVISASTFSSLNYYELQLETADIRNILGNGGLASTGGVINIEFSTSGRDYPAMLIEGGADYFLYRSNGRGAFKPVPAELYFLSSPELRDFENAKNSINADVVGNSSNPEYAYVSMYIAAVGTNPNTFSNIFSKPTHIGIFKLP